jgi:excisionase family DNA binding protein
MAVTKAKRKSAKTPAKPGKTPPEAALHTTGNAEVLTLAEAAAFLRVQPDELLRLVGLQGLPARQIGTEWRFLKSALEAWLRSPVPRPSKEALLAVIGSWKDDPDLDAMLKEIYERRGRSMIEDHA